MSGLFVIPWGISSNASCGTKVLLWVCLGAAVVLESWQEWKIIFLWFLAKTLQLFWLGLAFAKHFLVCKSSGCSGIFVSTLIEATVIILKLLAGFEFVFQVTKDHRYLFICATVSFNVVSQGLLKTCLLPLGVVKTEGNSWSESQVGGLRQRMISEWVILFQQHW